MLGLKCPDGFQFWANVTKKDYPMYGGPDTAHRKVYMLAREDGTFWAGVSAKNDPAKIVAVSRWGTVDWFKPSEQLVTTSLWMEK